MAEWLIETPFWAEGAGTGAGGVASFCTGLATSLRLTNMGYFWSAARQPELCAAFGRTAQKRSCGQELVDENHTPDPWRRNLSES